MNLLIVIGRLGKDPETRYGVDGKAIANFSIASRGKGKYEKPEWFNVVAFGKLAEICGQYLSKGKQTAVQGRLHTREWEDREGNKRKSTELIAQEIELLGSAGDGVSREDVSTVFPGAKVAEDDVPF